MKKGIILFLTIFILVSCGTDVQETSDRETTDRVTTENVEELKLEELEVEESEETAEVNTYPVENFDEFVLDHMFEDEIGNQAWEDYKKITHETTLGEEGLSDKSGNTTKEIANLMDNIVDENVVVDTSELIEIEHLTYYYGADTVEEASAIISFYFMEDELIYSAIVPSMYTLNKPTYEVDESFSSIKTLDELKAFEPLPQIFGVSEYKNEGQLYRALQVAASNSFTETESSLIVFMFKGDQLIDSTVDDFEDSASNTFEENAYLKLKNSGTFIL